MGMSPTSEKAVHEILQGATQPKFFGPAERQQRGQHTADRNQNKRHGEFSNRERSGGLKTEDRPPVPGQRKARCPQAGNSGPGNCHKHSDQGSEELVRLLVDSVCFLAPCLALSAITTRRALHW